MLRQILFACLAEFCPLTCVFEITLRSLYETGTTLKVNEFLERVSNADSAQLAMQSAVLDSVCPSVRLSVTLASVMSK